LFSLLLLQIRLCGVLVGLQASLMLLGAVLRLLVDCRLSAHCGPLMGLLHCS
jgi:hypothetical protein